MSLVVLLAAYILPGVEVSGFLTALVIGIINAFLKPLLLVLTLPVNVLTLGLFTFILNAFLIMLAASIVPGFHVVNFWAALLFSVALSIIWVLLSSIF